jgi:DNA-binding HxlR family transcriptional regulator
LADVTTSRPYGDGCAIAHAAELVGERWALLVVRELLLGPKRFADLQRGLPKVSPTVLSQRLRELEGSGVLCRRRLGPPASVSVYELTDWGLELEPIVMALARWSSRSAALDREAELSADSLILHMRARYDPRAGTTAPGRYVIRLGDDQFTLEVSGDAVTTSRGGHGEPRGVLDTTTPTLTAVLRGGVSFEQARARRRMQLEGDADAVRSLLQACMFSVAAR